MLDLILLVSDERLQQNDLLGGLRILNPHGHFKRLLQVPILVVTLRQVQLILRDLGIKLRQLLIHSGRVQKVLTHVVAVRQEGHRSTAWTELQLVVQLVDCLS